MSDRRYSRLDYFTCLLARVLIVVAVFLVLSGCRTAREEETLSAAGQATYKRGQAALQARQWDLAIKYFREIQTGRVTYPALLRDLGLAYAGAGDEVLAIAWLQAYVAKVPEAPDILAIRRELRRLAALGQDKVQDLFWQAVAAIEPDDVNKDNSLSVLAHFMASAGDVNWALDLGRQRQTRDSRPNEADVWADYASGLAREGNLDEVQQVLPRLTTSDQQDPVFHAMAMYHLEVQGNKEAARETALKIQQPQRRDGMLQFIDTAEGMRYWLPYYRPTVLRVVTRAQRITDVEGKRREIWQEAAKTQGQSPGLPADHPSTSRPYFLPRHLGEQAFILAANLRGLRIQADRIQCCLERSE
jgi:tetratricopeptide (TPR) repeat protein